MIIEKRHRLAAEVYHGFVVVSFTACLRNGGFFATNEVFKVFEEKLLAALRSRQCGSDVYLFMPDHIHMIIRGESEGSDVLRAMRTFKQQTGFWLSRNAPTVHWQKDYYDHILRTEVAIERHVRYILNNPVRAGLVGYWKDYQLKGSTLYNLKEWD
jgi:REP element-mobilizing transposase RayT